MQTDQHHAVMGDGDAHEIMRFVSCPDCAMGSLYAGSTPNQPFHQTPKSVALVNFHVPEARGRASGMASYAALSAFGLRRCAPQEPNARAAGSASLPRLKARIEPPRWPLSSPLCCTAVRERVAKFVLYVLRIYCITSRIEVKSRLWNSNNAI